MSDLRKVFDRAVRAAEDRSYIAGRVGRVNPDGSVSIDVAGKPNFVYVRVGAEGELGVSIARNTGVPKRKHLPVRMRRENGVLVIYGVDHTNGRLDTFLGHGGLAAVNYHTHRPGSGLEYVVSGQLLEPGLVQPAGGLSVWINPFRYHHNGVWQTWEGGTLDLTSYQPATADTHAWVLVGIDPATNTAVAAAGSETPVATSLNISDLDAIAFSGYIPCGAVRVRADDAKLTDVTRFVDARGWLNLGGGGGGALSSLSDVDLTGLADNDLLQYDAGSSTWKPVAPAGASQTFYAVQIDDQTPVTEGLDGTNNSNSSYAYIDETLSIPVPFEATDFLIDIFRADTYTLTITRAGVQLASIQAVVASDSTNDVSFTPAQPVVLSGLCTFRLTGTAVRQMRYNDGGTALHSYFSLLGLSFGGVTSGTTWHLPMKIELNPGMWTEITT